MLQHKHKIAYVGKKRKKKQNKRKKEKLPCVNFGHSNNKFLILKLFSVHTRPFQVIFSTMYVRTSVILALTWKLLGCDIPFLSSGCRTLFRFIHFLLLSSSLRPIPEGDGRQGVLPIPQSFSTLAITLGAFPFESNWCGLSWEETKAFSLLFGPLCIPPFSQSRWE